MMASELITELTSNIKAWGDAEVYAHHEDEYAIDTVMAVDGLVNKPNKIVLSQW